MIQDLTTEELKAELRKRQAAVSKVKTRYEITGEWSGYTPEQSKLAYREYTTSKVIAEKIAAMKVIKFTDGTYLTLNVRQMEHGEKKKITMTIYASLIRNCIEQSISNVDDLDMKKWR